MEQVLIYENTQAIEEYIKVLESYTSQWQKAIDECIKIGIEPNIAEIDILWRTLKQNNFSEKAGRAYIEDFVREKLANKVAVPEIGGVKISRSKFLEMIELPDCKVFVDAIFGLSYYSLSREINFNLYSLINNKIVITNDSIEAIKEMSTHRFYAITQKQLEAYNCAQIIVDTLNKLTALGVVAPCQSRLITYIDEVPRVNCLVISNIQ